MHSGTKAAARARLCLGILLAVVLVLTGESFGFDAGYHFDLTRDVLLRESFDWDGLSVVQVSNFYNDGFEASKAVAASPEAWGIAPAVTAAWTMVLFAPASLRDASDTYLHFDDLNNYDEVAATWDKLVRNTYTAVKDAERRGDTLGFLTALGMSLHQVQDFYAHSNWAELDWGGDATWFDVPEAEKRSATIYTSGSRGGVPHDRLNKDYAGRANFEKAYREAFYASWQWVRLVRSWVNADTWQSARLYSDSGVDLEKHFARYISWYIGHWKGYSSKSYDDMLLLSSAYVSAGGRHYIAKWKELCPTLTGAPDASLSVPLEIGPLAAQKWLRIKINTVYQTDDDLFWNIDGFGADPDFYAKIKVDGVEYIEAMHEDDSRIEPENWLTLAPMWADDNHVRVELAIWDEDVAGGGTAPSLRGGDDLCDISKELGRKTWFADGPPDFFRGGQTFHVDGFRYDAGWSDPDGDGDEAACDFVIALQQPARRAPSVSVALPPMRPAQFVPPTPLVSDEGELTRAARRLHITWEIPRSLNSPPVTEGQYRVRDRDMGVVQDWTSAGTEYFADIALPLRTGHKYFADVKARNEVGWSEVGSSDGITADLEGPRVAINSFNQTSAWPLGPAPTGTPIVYPNSFQVSLVGEDRGWAGFDRYLIWITEEIALSQSGGGSLRQTITPPRVSHISLMVLKADVKKRDTREGVVVLRGLPYLYDGRTYTLRVKGMDNIGNIGEAATATCTVHFRDTTPPPAPAPRVVSTAPLKVVWEEANDQESGTAEYKVAIASNASLADRPDILRWQSVGRALEYKYAKKLALPARWCVFVKAVNGMGQESVGRVESRKTLLPASKPLKPLSKRR